jgi:hypothetical protein
MLIALVYAMDDKSIEIKQANFVGGRWERKTYVYVNLYLLELISNK